MLLALVAGLAQGAPPADAGPRTIVPEGVSGFEDDPNKARSFAPPVAVGPDSVLLFIRDKPFPVLATVDTRSGAVSNWHWPLAIGEERYGAASNGETTWLVGPRWQFLHKGQMRAIESPGPLRDEPLVLALSSGGALALGGTPEGSKTPVDHIQEVPAAAGGKRYRSTPLAPLPATGDLMGKAEGARYGFSAVELADGRVLVTGGMYISGERAYAHVLDLRTGRWSAVADMLQPRLNHALLRLRDGRVLAANEYSAEVWHPAENRWTLLPPLPLRMSVTGYHRGSLSAAELPDGTILLGGADHRWILGLGPGAAYWQVAGQLEVTRAGGRLFGLAGGQFAIAGGSHLTNGCCHGTEGLSLLRLPAAGSGSPVPAPWFTEAARTQRGKLVFSAGGYQLIRTAFGEVIYSAVAQLTDTSTGRTRELPPVPHPVPLARAAWIDDDRIFLKGIAVADSRGFRPGDFESFGVKAAPAVAAVFSISRNSWTELALPEIAQAELIGLRGDLAYFADSVRGFWSYSFSEARLQPLAAMPRGRSPVTGRVLDDGRVIVAGGRARADWVEPAVDEDGCGACGECEICEGEDVAFGPMADSDTYAIYSPATGRWEESARGQQVASGPAAVMPDGRVVRVLGGILDRSRADGRSWTGMLLPPDRSFESMELMTSLDSGSPIGGILFLRIGSLGVDDRVPEARDTVRLWMYEAATGSWRKLGEWSDFAALTRPVALPVAAGGKKTWIAGFYRGPIVGWTE